jgi:hypothetical protein
MLFFRSRVAATIVSVVASVVLGACSGNVQPAITAGLDACTQCNMVIDTVNQACGYVHEGEFVTFDSPGCLLKSYDALRRQGENVATEIYFADYDSAELVRAEETVFLLTEHIPTVMDYGVLCFSAADGAQASRRADDEEIINWSGYRRLRGQPDTIVEATITSAGLVPEIIEVTKGDLVLVKLDGSQLAGEITISVRGYPEIGEIVVMRSGQPTEVRFNAIRPGAGFPVVGVDDQVIGMIRVAGAHTMDEEAM